MYLYEIAMQNKINKGADLCGSKIVHHKYWQQKLKSKLMNTFILSFSLWTLTCEKWMFFMSNLRVLWGKTFPPRTGCVKGVTDEASECLLSAWFILEVTVTDHRPKLLEKNTYNNTCPFPAWRHCTCATARIIITSRSLCNGFLVRQNEFVPGLTGGGTKLLRACEGNYKFSEGLYASFTGVRVGQ